MKIKEIVIIGLLLIGSYSYSQQRRHPQQCDTLIHGKRPEPYSVYCKKDILITVTQEDEFGTEITGSLITLGKISIKPAYRKKVKIVADSTSVKTHRSTNLGGNNDGDEKPENTKDKSTQLHHNAIYREAPFDTSIIISPNPITTTLFIQAENPIVAYKIFNSLGNICKQGKTIDNGGLLITELPEGLYYIRLLLETGSLSKTFYKK